MKQCLLLILFLHSLVPAYARHSKGSSLTYKYLGAGVAANTSKYEVTVLHYVNCQEIRIETGEIYLGIFNGATHVLFDHFTVKRSNSKTVQRRSFDACINPKPTVCYFVTNYTTVVELPDNAAGYLLTEQGCCHAKKIVNIQDPVSTGTTNTATIPGVINNVDYHKNSSPVLAMKDTAAICFNSYFEIDFSGVDTDGDELVYSFCAIDGGGKPGNQQPNPPDAPPYKPVTYAPGYSGVLPMGNGVSINSKTGLISGIAPATTGQYSIAVCIQEIRNGVLINTTKKEALVTVADCTVTSAKLNPVYINCDSLSMRFENESTAANISSYKWDFGVSGTDADVSNEPAPAFTYPAAGSYLLKLTVSSETGCNDSTTATVKVYPGFTPAFTVLGSCYLSPFTYTDATYAAYGAINSRNWDFGDITSFTDVSTQRNAAYQYAKPGNVTVTLHVASSVGCSGSISKIVRVNDKPQIVLPFTDTLICKGDSLRLGVETVGNIQWKPAYNMEKSTTANPVVYPAATTNYTVTVTDKACADSARVKVKVLDSVTIKLPADTGMCLTDNFILKPVSDALHYAWSESGSNHTLSSTQIKNPVAMPVAQTTYYVTANLGNCMAQAQMVVHVSPYPAVNAGTDTTVCYGSTAILHGATSAASHTWSPVLDMARSNTLQPLAAPKRTTLYVLTASDTFYCTIPVKDSVLVTVLPPVDVFAGNDTTIAEGQPLQLHAASPQGIIGCNWSPAMLVNNSAVANPFVNYNRAGSVTYTVTAFTTQGCKGTDDITVLAYKTTPGMLIPNAFTPNQDGQNDVFRPVTPGIARFNFFRIYNRWGKMVFETTEAGKGWDGTLNGKAQPPGTYVYTGAGIDYLNKPVVKKGTVVLIR